VSVSVSAFDPAAPVSERPASACVLCPPPRLDRDDPRAWTQADSRHVTCSGCYDRIREQLAEVAERYLLLDPRPGANRIPGMRGAPGFGSRSPASDHVIAMRDSRSDQLSRVWKGGDGRVHAESERPARSVWLALSGVAWSIAEHRDVEGPGDRRDNVFELLRFIDRHLDYVTRHTELAVEVSETLRRLVSSLRPVTGAGRKWIGKCPNLVQLDIDIVDERFQLTGEPAEPIRCDADLFAPRLFGNDAGEETPDDTIVCHLCDAEWPRERWLELGDQLNAEVLRVVC
jgi:hypothetical protein